jgi:hypothetical protein
MFCPSCGRHFLVMGALGQWIARCDCSDTYIRFCQEEAHLGELDRQLREGNAAALADLPGHQVDG